MFSDFILNYSELLIPAITGALTLLGVVIGSKLSRRNEVRASRRKEITESYAAFFSAYTDYISSPSEQNKSRVVASLEVARLLFPSKASALFSEFESQFIHGSGDISSRAQLLDQIRKQAMDDILKL